MENLILIGTVIIITVVLMVLFGSKKKSKEVRVVDSVRHGIASKLQTATDAEALSRAELAVEFNEILTDAGMDSKTVKTTLTTMRDL